MNDLELADNWKKGAEDEKGDARLYCIIKAIFYLLRYMARRSKYQE